eukprot:CAMPEP_0179978688 /NCGR_PEP_ID=MMETSP0983-20121128/40835_1 /TAXON_ID=483367 /ORGANISM="non described non described, Strain CCMP 2436" /LENGTH=137 /DNA_ID=CAMNT_0021896177 /DNA_START=332 /DNA_END=747 /DNA_ORIENTATION=+
MKAATRAPASSKVSIFSQRLPCAWTYLLHVTSTHAGTPSEKFATHPELVTFANELQLVDVPHDFLCRCQLRPELQRHCETNGVAQVRREAVAATNRRQPILRCRVEGVAPRHVAPRQCRLEPAPPYTHQPRPRGADG